VILKKNPISMFFFFFQKMKNKICFWEFVCLFLFFENFLFVILMDFVSPFFEIKIIKLANN
jgi:hypothetical protein